MKKLNIKVSLVNYEISVDDDIANRMTKEVESDLSLNNDNDIKKLLAAYLKKCNQLIEIEKRLNALDNKFKE